MVPLSSNLEPNDNDEAISQHDVTGGNQEDHSINEEQEDDSDLNEYPHGHQRIHVRNFNQSQSDMNESSLEEGNHALDDSTGALRHSEEFDTHAELSSLNDDSVHRMLDNDRFTEYQGHFEDINLNNDDNDSTTTMILTGLRSGDDSHISRNLFGGSNVTFGDAATHINRASFNPRQLELWGQNDAEYERRRHAIVMRELERIQRSNFLHFFLLCLVPTSLLLIVLMSIMTKEDVCTSTMRHQCFNEERTFTNAYTTRCICLAIVPKVKKN